MGSTIDRSRDRDNSGFDDAAASSDVWDLGVAPAVVYDPSHGHGDRRRTDIDDILDDL